MTKEEAINKVRKMNLPKETMEILEALAPVRTLLTDLDMKYIDAERLKEILKSQIKERKEWMKDIDRSDRQDQLWSDLNGEDMSILQIIDSLQQEQPEDSKGKFVFPKFLYARTTDNKTIDVSYVPQDMTAIEYVRNDSVEQEQPEVDLEAETQMQWDSFNHYLAEYGDDQEEVVWLNWNSFKDVCRDLYELGKNSR